MGEDKNLYNNIFLFLKNGIKNNKRTWPYYITEITDKNIKLKK